MAVTRDQSLLVAAGGGGVIVLSEDGGDSWSWCASACSDTTQHIHSIDAWDKNHIYAGADNNRILQSHDGGASWGRIVSGGNMDWRGLYAQDPTRFVAASQKFGEKRITRYTPRAELVDYTLASSDWNVAPNGMFGACLMNLVDAIEGWDVDTYGTSNDCDTVDTDPWNPIPADPVTVAQTASGDMGTATLLYGIHAGPTQSIGDY